MSEQTKNIHIGCLGIPGCDHPIEAACGCKCHQSKNQEEKLQATTEDWEKECEKLFLKEYEILEKGDEHSYIHRGLDNAQQYSHLKDFIRKEIDKAFRRGVYQQVSCILKKEDVREKRTTENWEKAFDERFVVPEPFTDDMYSIKPSIVKDFILSLLQNQRDSFVEMVKGLKKEDHIKLSLTDYQEAEPIKILRQGEIFGYNQALDDLLTSLEKLK